jgi:predicted DNA-binding transcriptional regulator AlpA
MSRERGEADMDKRWYTVTTSTGPLDQLSDELLELVATALAKSRHLRGTVASGNTLTRTLSIRGSVDVPGVADAILAAFEDVGKALHRAGVENADIVDFAVVQDLPEDEFASARDDIVGTPDVAARLGISRQRVAQLVDQQGRFPHPIATVRGTHVWRWGDIADWVAAGARDLRRKQPSAEARALADPAHNTIDLMDALKRKVATADHRGPKAATKTARAR